MAQSSPLIPLLVGALLSLEACGVEQARPVPVVDADRWGHLPPDPQRAQQAGAADAGAGASRG